MRYYKDLKLGFNDAENYKRQENKNLLNECFLRTKKLEDLLINDRYYLIGDKGTGKTAYAVFLNNNLYKNTISSIKFVRETDYRKFIQLKKEKDLSLSDYKSIWCIILCLLFTKQLQEKEFKKPLLFSKKSKIFDSLNEAVEEYYHNAFSPEIVQAIDFVTKTDFSANIIVEKLFSATGEKQKQESFKESKYQTALYFIENKFREAFKSIKVEKNHILFIDGIDIRPENISYEEYIDCIKGLANAIWELNCDVLSQTKDSKGAMKCVLLLRPDIMALCGLNNLNSKIIDNSVVLEWRTKEERYRESLLFELADKILRVQQDGQEAKEMKLGDAWDYYFPPNNASGSFVIEPLFCKMLKYTYQRPRDIVTALKIIQNICTEENINKTEKITQKILNDARFVTGISEYLIGEIKDYMLFYYSQQEYDSLLKLFGYFYGTTSIKYNAFVTIYESFKSNYLNKKNITSPLFDDPNDLLEKLYDMNIISYCESSERLKFARFCFREKSLSNMFPKVKTEENVEYYVHKGLWKELKLGEIIKK